MKVKTLIVATSVVLTSCSSWTGPKRQIASVSESSPYYKDFLTYEENFESFNKDISKSLDLRIRAMTFYDNVKDKVLSSQDLELIHTAAKEYAINRESLLAKVEDEKWYSDKDINFNVVSTPTKIDKKYSNWFERMFSFAYKFDKDINISLNPDDDLGRLNILKMKQSLVAAMMLYDNYILAIMPYDENKKLRRTVNFDNVELDNLIKEITGNFRKLENYKRTLRVVEYVQDIIDWEKKNPDSEIVKNSYNAYLNELIIGSYTYGHIGKITMGQRIKFRLERFATIIRDDIFKIGDSTMNLISMGFGNTVGLVQTRSGKLKNISINEEKSIRSQLKPLDILLEKTPFRLTDKFIPGHWGHVAIWVGNKEQLQELGMWDELDELYEYAVDVNDYKGPTFKKLIESNHNIVEALRPGVQLNSLRHFIDIDDLAVVRPKEELDLEQTKHYIRRAFKQIGKEYDFNFNVQTDKKIVCSELAYVVFEDYEWPTDKQAGRYTISPDHVAVKAKEDGQFKPVMIYHDGRKIAKNLQKNFDLLLDLKYDQIRYEKAMRRFR